MKYLHDLPKFTGDARFEDERAELYDRTTNHPVIEFGDNELTMTGNTYPIKDTLKANGFRWTGTYWKRRTKNDEEMDAVVNNLIASIPDLYTNNQEAAEYYG